MRPKNSQHDCLSVAFDIVLQLPFGTTPKFIRTPAKRKHKNKVTDFWNYVYTWLWYRGFTYVLIRSSEHPADVIKELKENSTRTPIILIGRTDKCEEEEHATVLYNGVLYDSRWEATGIPRTAIDGGTLIMILVPRPKGKFMNFKGMYRVDRMKRMVK